MVKIELGSITIDQVSNVSGVFSGDNHHYGWRYSSKTNEGFGSVIGSNNQTVRHTHVVIDQDYMDQWQGAPLTKSDS